MLRELAGLIDQENKLREQNTEFDWVDRLTVRPSGLVDEKGRPIRADSYVKNRYGGLYWLTNYSVSCAASVEGVSRLLDIADRLDDKQSYPATSEVVGYLATRAAPKGQIVSFVNSATPEVNFLREEVVDDTGDEFAYLPDILRVLPVHGTDRSLKQATIDRLSEY